MLEIGFPKFGRLLYQNRLAIKDHITYDSYLIDFINKDSEFVIYI
jgi:hypothetical protein